MKEPERSICNKCFEENGGCIESLEDHEIPDDFIEKNCRELISIKLRNENKEMKKVLACDYVHLDTLDNSGVCKKCGWVESNYKPHGTGETT